MRYRPLRELIGWIPGDVIVGCNHIIARYWVIHFSVFRLAYQHGGRPECGKSEWAQAWFSVPS